MFLFIGNCFFCGQILREIDKPFFLFMKKTINYYTKAYLEEKNILFWLIINLMGIFLRDGYLGYVLAHLKVIVAPISSIKKSVKFTFLC